MNQEEVVLEAAAQRGAAGERGLALVTIVRTTGSVPRHPPSKMLVSVDGSLVGTIGGGKVELEVVALALKVAAGQAPAQKLEKHLVRDLAMCCGGAVELWVEPLDGARWKALAEALRRRRARRASALVTELPTGDRPGAKELLDGHDVLATRRARLEDGRFVEPVLPNARLVLFGAGHVAHAVAPLALNVGFEVVVCDEEESFASEARFPGVQLLHSFDAKECARELGGWDADDHVIVLTRDHAIDQTLIEALLPSASSVAYLGLIGSRGKVERFRKRLEGKPDWDADAWAKLHAPVGLAIGAEDPEEIALAIVGDLVKTRAARRGAR